MLLYAVRYRSGHLQLKSVSNYAKGQQAVSQCAQAAAAFGLLGEYTVDKIVDQSECDDGEVEYLVVWAGYDHPNEHTWEPKEVVADTEALDSWEARASSI